jgi:prepilin-type processing-associated H-X9-DG protein
MVESSGAAAPRKAGLGSIIVAVVVLVVLVLVLLPHEWNIDEAGRASCANNLSQIGRACRTWADVHRHVWPDVFTEQSTHWHEVGNTRTDACSSVRDDGEPPVSQPSDNGAAIQSNTANLWALIGQMGLTPYNFVCPSSVGRRDSYVTDYKSVRDFRGEPFCSYSFQNLLGPYMMTETMSAHSSTLAVAADANPMRRDCWSGGPGGAVPIGVTNRRLAEKPRFEESDETDPWSRQVKHIRQPWELNSPNHKFKGQNVLYLDGHVEWKEHPYSGVNWDNIWLRRRTDVTAAINPQNIDTIRAYNDEASYNGQSTLDPKSEDDSFLVP